MKTLRAVSDVTAVLVLLLISILVVSVVLVWGSIVVQQPVAVASRERIEVEEKLKESISLVYWGPNGVMVLTNSGSTHVRIIRLYVGENSVIPVDWSLEPGETKSFRSGVPYNPHLTVAVLTDKNELWIIWWAR